MGTQAIVHHPLIFRVGPLQISGFGIALGLAFIIAYVILRREIARRGHDPAPVADALLFGIIGFMVGSKLYYAIVTGDPSTLVRPGGLVFWAGATSGVLAGFWMARRRGMPIMRAADPTAIGLAAGYAIGRTGCWAVGDDYGRPWGSPLAVAFPRGMPPSTAAILEGQFGIPIPPGVWPGTVMAVHPTQLYETALGLVMFFILWRLRDHKHAEGWLFGVYMVLAGVERFFIEFVRVKDDHVAAGLTLAQLTAAAVAVGGMVWMLSRQRVSQTSPGIYARVAGGQ
jgi:phosphatidylglycerol:prolipoprotein diacylglycerol transferase